MLRYSECEYSLFISYAHADDKGNNWWVSSLKQAIWNRLADLPREIGKLELHLSGENGPSVGHLSDELKERVRKSFGMLLVIGDNYVTSGWCEEELKFFSAVFGPEGTQKRLFVAVMSEKALKQAEKGEHWKRIIAKDQLWVPMYQDNYPNSPLKAKLDDGTFSDTFFQQAKRIADPLIQRIERDFEDSPKVPQSVDAGTLAAAPTPWSAPASQQLRVAIGPCTDNLVSKAEMLKGALEKAGADVTLFDRSVIDDYDPDDGLPLRPALNPFDVLVAPIADGKPLRPDIEGGHATILAKEWATLNKRRSIVWYRPSDVEIQSNQMAAAKHLEKFHQFAPVCTSEQAVANLLFGIGSASAIKVYIEKHPKEPVYYRLSRQLQAAWNALPAGSNRPPLRCELLDLDDLDSKPKDVAAVILLLPDGLKNSASLRAQETLVQKTFPKKGSTYPGCVALIFKPPPKSAAMHDWADVKFCKNDQEPKLVIDAESKEWLDEFLIDVWEQYQSESASI
jgi:hypothetical protein